MKEVLERNTIDREKKNGYSEEVIKNAWQQANTMFEFQQILIKMETKQQSQIQVTQQKETKSSIIQQQKQSTLKSTSSIKNEKEFDYSQLSDINQLSNMRENTIPCGLLNRGNMCYFNSLIQTYFFNRNFIKMILQWKVPKSNDIKYIDEKLEKSVKLVENLQKLIIKMIGTDEKFIDPLLTIQYIRDDNGNSLQIYEQQDVAEFNHYFLSRLNEGLNYTVYQYPAQERSKKLDKSELKKYYFGQQIYEIDCLNNNNNKKQSNTIDEFNIIPIQVKFGNFQTALEQAMSQSLIYRDDNGNEIDAIKRFTITQLPQVLSFQIQRVIFSPSFEQALKDNREFHFDKEIDISKYYNNQQQIKNKINKSKIIEINNEIRIIENNLEEFTKFNSGQDIITTLQCILQFSQLGTQANNQYKTITINEDNTDIISKLQGWIQELNLRKDNLIKRKQVLELQLKEYEQQLNNYEESSQIYILQSIIMHQGFYSSGHYYSYVYDFYLKKWFNINDKIVRECSESSVFSDAFGEIKNNQSNAYMLVYMKKEYVQEELSSTQPIRNFCISRSKEYLKDIYGGLLNLSQIEYIKNENKRFAEEQQQKSLYSDTKYFDIDNAVTIYLKYWDIYQKQLSEIQEFCENNPLIAPSSFGDQTLQPPFIQSLPLFQHIYILYNTQEDVKKWTIIDQIVKEQSNNQFGIFFQEGFINEELVQYLLQKISVSGHSNKIIKYLPVEGQQLFINEYKQQLNLAIKLLKLTHYFLNQQYEDTVIVLHNFINDVKSGSAQAIFFRNIALILKTIIPLSIFGYYFNQSQLLENDLLVLKLLVQFQLLQTEKDIFTKKYDMVYQQYFQILASQPKNKNSRDILLTIANAITYEKNIGLKEQLNQLPKDYTNFVSETQSKYNLSRFNIKNDDQVFESMVMNLQIILNLEQPNKLLNIIQYSQGNLTIQNMEQIFKE